MIFSEKAASLISQLTLEEKASLVTGINMWQAAAIEWLGTLSIMMMNGPHGV